MNSPNHPSTKSVTWECPCCNHESTATIAVDAQTITCTSCSAPHAYNDIVHLADDATAYFNRVDELSIAAYGTAAGYLTEDEAALHSLQNSFVNNVMPDVALQIIRSLQAKELWAKLGNIPCTDDGFTKEPFLHFKRMVSTEHIWGWFESEFKLSVHDLMFPSTANNA